MCAACVYTAVAIAWHRMPIAEWHHTQIAARTAPSTMFSIILGLGTAAHLQHIAQKYIHEHETLQINHLLCYSCIAAPHADWGAKKAEFSMLNAQRWSGWIDSYAMAIFDIFQPNWNLFDYPNKVQIASSRSITTTGNG